MAETKIEWTATQRPDGSWAPGYTFNPWIGCTKVSAGCKNCYAEADMDNRRKRVVWGTNGTRSVTAYSYWRQALKWNREAEAAGERRKVFCASLADVFENWQGDIVNRNNETLYWVDRDVMVMLGLHRRFIDVQGIPLFAQSTQKIDDTFRPMRLNDIREMLFWLIENTQNLDWLLLTKRPENIMGMVPERWRGKFPKNVWIGTSVEDQEQAGIRIPHLLKVPSFVRFISMEPMLSAVDLTKVTQTISPGYFGDCLQPYHIPLSEEHLPYPVIHMVIVGGESGHNKRPFDAEWARSIMNQCFSTDTAFFMKQMDKKQPIPNDIFIRQFPKHVYTY